MDILIVSTVFAAISWIIAIFLLFSVIHLNRIEKILKKYFLDSGSSKHFDVETPLSNLRENYQRYFYWAAGVGIAFYILPELY